MTSSNSRQKSWPPSKNSSPSPTLPPVPMWAPTDLHGNANAHIANTTTPTSLLKNAGNYPSMLPIALHTGKHWQNAMLHAPLDETWGPQLKTHNNGNPEQLTYVNKVTVSPICTVQTVCPHTIPRQIIIQSCHKHMIHAHAYINTFARTNDD